jgi:hypothetical protein
MKHQIALAVIAILVDMAGCGYRECDYVKTAKGDQICQEDVESEDESEPVKAEESGWHAGREAPKE